MAAKTAGGETLYCSTLDATDSQRLEAIYKFSDDIAATKDFAQFADGFGTLLEAAGGSTRVKTLLATLIPKYAMHFPERQAEAADVVATLVADADSAVQLHAAKGLPQLCKDAKGQPLPDCVGKATDFLVRAISKDPSGERKHLTAALEAINRIGVADVCDRLIGFLEATEGEDHEALRETARRLLAEKVASHATELLKPFPEVEESLKTRIVKVLGSVPEAEFQVLVDLLKGLRIFEAGQRHGPQGLVDIVAEQSLLSAPIEPEAVEALQRSLECVNIALSVMKKGVLDHKMTTNIVQNVMPVFQKLEPAHQLLVLQRLTQLAPFAAKDAATAAIPAIFELLSSQLAEQEASSNGESNGANGVEGAEKPLPDVAFTLVEALLFLVHQYSAKDPERITEVSGIPFSESTTVDLDKYKALKKKLLYTYEVCDTLSRKLNTVIPKTRGIQPAGDPERRQVLEQGVAALKNISDMIRPLVTAKPSSLQSLPSGKFSWEKAVVQTRIPKPKRSAGSPADPQPAKKQATGSYVPLARRSKA